MFVVVDRRCSKQVQLVAVLVNHVYLLKVVECQLLKKKKKEINSLSKEDLSQYIQRRDEAGDAERPGIFAGIILTLGKPRWMSFCCCL